MTKTAEISVLLKSERQALKVRVVFFFLLAVALAALWAGWAIFQSFGLSPADGGVLKPFWQRLAFGGFVAGLGVAAAAGMWLYLTLYALQISRHGNRVAIVTMTPAGRREREFPVGDIGESAYYHGRVHHVLSSGRRSSALWVNAPWITLRVRGRRLPFIIDLQAEHIEIGELSVLAEGGVGEWRQDRGA